MDGQAFWGLLKSIFGECDDIQFTWLSLNEAYVEKSMLLTEYYIDGYGTKTMNKSNHFKIQTARLCTETPNLRKLMQVALNIGFYEASVKDSHALNNLLICDYISNTDLRELDEKIPNDMLSRYSRVLADYVNDQGLEMV